MAENKWVRVHSGHLLKCPSKKSRVRKRWRQRWYVLYSCGEASELQHFDSLKQAMRGGHTSSAINKDTVELIAALYSHPKHDNVICIQLKTGKEVYLAASASDDMHAWHSALAEQFNQRMICLKVQWQYQNDSMEWCNYSESGSAKLEDMRQRGITTFSLDKGLSTSSKAYLIYLDNMLQASPRSGTKRLIQRLATKLPARKGSSTSDMQPPPPSSLRVATSLPPATCRSTRPSLAVPSAGSPSSSPRSITPGSDYENRHVGGGESDSDDDGSVEDSEGDMHTWIYATDAGEWARYDKDHSAMLETEYLAQAPICVMMPGKATGTWFKRRGRKKANQTFVTFGAMQEINPANCKRREVRRVLPTQIAHLKAPAEVTNVSELIGVETMQSAGTSYPEFVGTEPSLSRLQIPADSIKLQDIIGQGAFGRVSLAKLVTAEHPEGIDVAVKTLQDNSRKGSSSSDGSRDQKLSEEILKEATTMVRFQHPNIVRLVGVCSSEGSTMLVMEYMNRSDLLHYLRKSATHLRLGQQLSVILQVAQAMVYLVEEQQFVHRDVAARNVLVHQESDGTLLAKVTDFGLSRDLYSSSGYRMSMAVDKLTEVRLPAKWMALESLEYFIFNSATDVWSFGVMMWEVLTHGQVPYAGIEAPLMYLELRRGLQLERPTTCPEKVYAVILNCCKHNPKERPTFGQLRDELSMLLCDPALTEVHRSGVEPMMASSQNDWDDEDYKPQSSLARKNGPLSLENEAPPRPEKPSPLQQSPHPKRPPKPSSRSLLNDPTAEQVLDDHVDETAQQKSKALSSVPVAIPSTNSRLSPPPLPQRAGSKQCFQQWVQNSLHQKLPADSAQARSVPESSEFQTGRSRVAETGHDSDNQCPMVPSSLPSQSTDDAARPTASAAERAASPPSEDGRNKKAHRTSLPSEAAGTIPKNAVAAASTTLTMLSSQAQCTTGLSTTMDKSHLVDKRTDAEVAKAAAAATRNRKTSGQILERMKMFEKGSEKPPLPPNKPVLKGKIVEPRSTGKSPSPSGSTAMESDSKRNSSPQQGLNVTSAGPSNSALGNPEEEVANKSPISAKKSALGSTSPGRRSTMPGNAHMRLAGRRTTLSNSCSVDSEAPRSPPAPAYSTKQELDTGNQSTLQTDGSHGDVPATKSAILDSQEASLTNPVLPKKPSADDGEEVYMAMAHSPIKPFSSMPSPKHEYENLRKSPGSTPQLNVDPSIEDDYEVILKKEPSVSADETELVDGVEYTMASELAAVAGSTPDPCVSVTPPVPLTDRPTLYDRESNGNGPIVDEGYTSIADLVRNSPDVTLPNGGQQLAVELGTDMQPAGKGRRSFSLLKGFERIKDSQEFDLLPLLTLRALAEEERIPFNLWQKEDELRSRLREKWLQLCADTSPSAASPTSPCASPDAPVRPPAPLPLEALSPLERIVASRKRSSEDQGAGDTTDGGEPPSLPVGTSRVSVPATAVEAVADAKPGTASSPHSADTPGSKPANKAMKPPVPRRPNANKPPPPPRPSPEVLARKRLANGKRNEPAPEVQGLYEVDEATSQLQADRAPPVRLSTSDSRGYIDTNSIQRTPMESASGTSLVTDPSEKAGQRGRKLVKEACYLTVAAQGSPEHLSDSNATLLELENEVFRHASLAELHGLVRCSALSPPSTADLEERGQVLATIRCAVRSQARSPGLVNIAGGILAATRLVMRTTVPRLELPKTPSTTTDRDSQLAEMYEEGYTEATELVFRGMGKAAAEKFAAAANSDTKSVKSSDSVFSGNSSPDDGEKQAAGIQQSRSKPRPPKTPPPLHRKPSEPTLTLAASPERMSPTPQPQEKKKGRLASAYSHHILPKFSTLLFRKPKQQPQQEEDAKPEKAFGRKVRSKSITDISFLKVNRIQSDVAAGGTTMAVSSRKFGRKSSAISIGKRGSVDDTFLDNLKASPAYPPPSTTAPENAYLMPNDVIEENEYAPVLYATPGEDIGTQGSSSLADIVDDSEYLDMSGYSCEEEYQEMAAFSGPGPPSVMAHKSLPAATALLPPPQAPNHTTLSPTTSNTRLHNGSSSSSTLHSAGFSSKLAAPNTPSRGLASTDGADLVIPRRYDASLPAHVPYSVKPLSQVGTPGQKSAAYKVTDAVSLDDSNFQLSDVKTPEDIHKLSTTSICAFLRVNSIKHSESTSRVELVEEAKQLWSDDSYLPIADIIVPRLDKLPTEAAVRALRPDQHRMILESNGHDGATDCNDEEMLIEYVLQLWREQLVPIDPMADKEIRPSDIKEMSDRDVLALARNHRLSIASYDTPQDVREKVWNLWIRKQDAITGFTRSPGAPGTTTVK